MDPGKYACTQIHLADPRSHCLIYQRLGRVMTEFVYSRWPASVETSCGRILIARGRGDEVIKVIDVVDFN